MPELPAKTVELTVPPEAAGRRLDAWLAEAVPERSRARVQRAVDAGQVLVDGRSRPKSYRLEGGERVEADLAPPVTSLEPIAGEPRVVWEDEHLLIVDKPAGVVVHPAPGHRATTLVEALTEQAAGSWQPYVVHRLDRDTSGLMLIAKQESVRGRLRRLIEAREVEREYLALVKGRLAARRGTIDAPLGRDRRRRTRMSTQTAKPRPARTHFEVERLVDGYTLVRARLETGRTHQIRAHFAATGNPVCGDPEYGGRGLLGLERQFLHSARLALPHPVAGSRLEQTSPLPPDLEEALRRTGN
jgi:23S rRNA pseudouridine1911/1915/1917 synthase